MRIHIKKSEPYTPSPLVFCLSGQHVLTAISTEKKPGPEIHRFNFLQQLLSGKIIESFFSSHTGVLTKEQHEVSCGKPGSIYAISYLQLGKPSAITYTYNRKMDGTEVNEKGRRMARRGRDSDKVTVAKRRKIMSGSVANYPAWETAPSPEAMSKGKMGYIRTIKGLQGVSGSRVTFIGVSTCFMKDAAGRPECPDFKSSISFEKNRWVLGFFPGHSGRNDFIVHSGNAFCVKNEIVSRNHSSFKPYYMNSGCYYSCF